MRANSGVINSYILNSSSQIAQIQNNPNNYNSNNGGVNYYQNNNASQIYLLAPISNQIPMNNYLLLSNSNQNQNHFIMPLMKTESPGYVMIKNLNENNSLNFTNMASKFCKKYFE